jgi:hypothetical protein
MSFSTGSILKSADLPEKVHNQVPQVMNRLLGKTFLYQSDEDDKEDYYLIHRHRDVFSALFSMVGFTLLHDDYHCIFQVVSDFGACRRRYKLDESLMIVVLRKLYEECSEQLNLAKDPVVTIGEIREEYRTITGQERSLGVVQYEDILRRMKRLGLIEPADGRSLDVRDSELRLRLRGSIKMILPVQTAEEMEAWLRKYRAQGQRAPGEEERDS